MLDRLLKSLNLATKSQTKKLKGGWINLDYLLIYLKVENQTRQK